MKPKRLEGQKVAKVWQDLKGIQGFSLRTSGVDGPKTVPEPFVGHPKNGPAPKMYNLPLKTPRSGEVNLLQTYSPCYPKS